jgi:hypothetical protein
VHTRTVEFGSRAGEVASWRQGGAGRRLKVSFATGAGPELKITNT